MCMCWFTYAYCFFGEGQLKKNNNNNNNKGICEHKSKLANISLFKEFVGDTI